MTAHDGSIFVRKEKKCPSCNKKLNLSEFPVDKQRKDGYGAYCKLCRKQINKKWRESNPEKYRISRLNTRRRIEYGLDPEKFEEMLKGQNYLCAICNINIDYNSHLDHCHETGKVRGILCRSCNLGLGNFSDNIDKLRAAIIYLEKIITI